MGVVVNIHWQPSRRGTSIWSRLAERLGREPTHAEATAEVKRILREAHA